MRVRVRNSGSCDGKSFVRNDVLDHDSESVRRLLINGIATPEDAQAEAILADAEMQSRFASAALAAQKVELDARDAKEAAEAPPA